MKTEVVPEALQAWEAQKVWPRWPGPELAPLAELQGAAPPEAQALAVRLIAEELAELER